jgi:hypothetical protein
VQIAAELAGLVPEFGLVVLVLRAVRSVTLRLVLSLILFQDSNTKGSALEFQREILCLREKAPLPDLFHANKKVVEGWLDALASEPYHTARPGLHLCGEETWVKYFTCICHVYRDTKGSVEYEDGDDALPVYASLVLSISLLDAFHSAFAVIKAILEHPRYAEHDKINQDVEEKLEQDAAAKAAVACKGKSKGKKTQG